MKIISIHYYQKIFSFKLSTTDNIFNGKPSDILHAGYLNKNISIGDIVYFKPEIIQHENLVNGVTGRFKISLIDGHGNEISSNFKISIVLHIVKFFLTYIYTSWK